MRQDTPPDTVCDAPDRATRLSLASLLPYVPTSARRVLDCTGEWANRGAALKAHGVREVVGLVDASAGEPAGGEGYDQLVTGPLDFTPIDFEPGSFDCLIFNHVLERLRNPEAFLKPVFECLSPGGLAVLTVPNVLYHKAVFSLAEGRWCYGESGVFARKNLRFYTAYEIRWILQRMGITNVRFASLVGDGESALPRDEQGFVRRGSIRIGPLSDEQYAAWRTEYYLVLATHR